MWDRTPGCSCNSDAELLLLLHYDAVAVVAHPLRRRQRQQYGDDGVNMAFYNAPPSLLRERARCAAGVEVEVMGLGLEELLVEV